MAEEVEYPELLTLLVPHASVPSQLTFTPYLDAFHQGGQLSRPG